MVSLKFWIYHFCGLQVKKFASFLVIFKKYDIFISFLAYFRYDHCQWVVYKRLINNQCLTSHLTSEVNGGWIRKTAELTILNQRILENSTCWVLSHTKNLFYLKLILFQAHTVFLDIFYQQFLSICFRSCTPSIIDSSNEKLQIIE